MSGALTRAASRGLVLLAGAGLAAGCGSQHAAATAPAPAPVSVPLSTSLVTPQGTWAVAVMGGPAASQDDFWQLFVRPAGASRWSLATPQGVADNGGLVAAGGSGSLTVGFRPSQNLSYSPLATSTDAGKNWTPGLLDAALADSPGAIAVSRSGAALALLQDGTIKTAPTAAAATAGQWTGLTTLKALATSAAGRGCGLQGVNAVSFGPDGSPVAAGSCTRPGAAGIFTEAGGTWRSAGLALPGARPVQVLGLAATADGNAALLAAGNSVFAAWRAGTRWTVSAPEAASAGAVRALGFGPSGSAWLLLAGGRAATVSAATVSAGAGAATVSAGAGPAWQALPALPPGTATLAPAGGSYDALAVSGSKLTVWRLAQRAWAKSQLITVPIAYGSSG